jgi:hypothetical protein
MFRCLISGGLAAGSNGGGSFLVIPMSVLIDEVSRKNVNNRNEISAIDPVLSWGIFRAISKVYYDLFK